jgi:hypothetical protein
MEKLCTNKNHSYKHNEQINKQNIDKSVITKQNKDDLTYLIPLKRVLQSSVKSIRKCKKNPYIINQNHIVKSFLDKF